MPLPNWQVFDRIRAFARQGNIFRSDNIYQDQDALDRVISGGNFIDFSRQSALLEQTNLQINRLERYKDYDMMDEVGEITLALDMYADEACLDGTVRIPLLDGTNPTIAELAQRGIEKQFWVYAYDLRKRTLVPALAKGARISGRNVQMVKVVLDDGAVIRCTDDHLFLLRSGEYREAGKLVPDDSLMPLYRNYQYRAKKSGKYLADRPYKTASCYESIINNGKMTTTHKWVYDSLNLEAEYEVIHHKDFNSRNNSPNNLDGMAVKEHNIIHQRFGNANSSFNPIKLSMIEDALSGWKKPLQRSDIFKLCDIGERVLYRVLNENNLTWKEFRARYHHCRDCYTKISVGLICDDCKKNLVGEYHQFKKSDNNYRERRLLNKRKSYKAVQERICNNCERSLQISFFQKNHCSYSPYCQDCREEVVQSRYLVKSFNNHKVVSVEPDGMAEKVYDIEVPGYHNFAAGDGESHVIVHNSLADPERKHSVIVKAKDSRLRKVVEDLLYNTLLMDKEIRPIVRYLCKYGDFPAEIVPTKNRDGVASFRFINVYNFTRIQTKFGDLVGFYYQDPTAMTPVFLHPWQTVHMRLTTYENTYHPYGRSVLDGGRKDFKRLRLMEDAALIYRITRAPEKRIFSIPVGNIPPKEVPQYIELIARQFKKFKFVDPATGAVNERYSPLIQEDDFFLPKRPDGSGPTIDTLPGAENLDAIADIEYFKKKMVAGLKIPFNRVGIGDQSEPDGKSLAQISPEFAKGIQWIQKEVINGLKKICIVHLAMRGHSIEDIKSFDLHMTAASAIDELYRIETWNTRADIMGNLKDIGWFPPEWIIERFTDMSPDEIREMQIDTGKDINEPEPEQASEERYWKDRENRLLSEYKNFNKRVKESSSEDQDLSNLEYMLNSKELDGLPESIVNGEDDEGKLLVENSIDDDIVKEVKDETATMLLGGTGIGDQVGTVKMIAATVSDETEGAQEADVADDQKLLVEDVAEQMGQDEEKSES